MTVKLRKRRRAERSLAHARLLACDDARALALEIGRGAPATVLDAMGAGLVLNPGESAYRRLNTWLYVQDGGAWGPPSWVNVVISNQRLICRMPDGALASLPWHGVLGLGVDLAPAHVILDYGDGQPLAFSGTVAPVVAVASVAFVYGTEALLVHPALDPLRS